MEKVGVTLGGIAPIVPVVAVEKHPFVSWAVIL